MRKLPDEGWGRWLDSLDYGLLTEAEAMLGPSWTNPAARRAVLHYLYKVRTARPGHPGEPRSTPGEWQRRISRLIQLLDGKERDTQRRARSELHHASWLPSRSLLELSA